MRQENLKGIINICRTVSKYLQFQKIWRSKRDLIVKRYKAESVPPHFLKDIVRKIQSDFNINSLNSLLF